MSSVEIHSGAWHGDRRFTLHFPESWDVQVVGQSPGPALDEQVMRERVQAPVGTARLADMARGCASAAIIIDDISRPTPTADLLPLVSTLR